MAGLIGPTEKKGCGRVRAMRVGLRVPVIGDRREPSVPGNGGSGGAAGRGGVAFAPLCRGFSWVFFSRGENDYLGRCSACLWRWEIDRFDLKAFRLSLVGRFLCLIICRFV